MIGKDKPGGCLSRDEIDQLISDALKGETMSGKRILALIPDATRSMPMPLLFDKLRKTLRQQAAQLDFLIALGTHQPMTDEQLTRLIGQPVSGGLAGENRVVNHRWDLPETFVTLGNIPAEETAQLTNGLFHINVPITLNRMILDYDHLLVCGPVFPHEVAGFSGGSKYFFPGIAGPAIINFTHWLGALITNHEINGVMHTPVRAVIDRAASFIDKPITAFSLVVTHAGTTGIYYGSLQESWQAAARHSEREHVIYVDHPYRTVLSVMPAMYDDLWTAAKGMYKVEPVVADNGEVIIYAPHIREVSHTHGQLIDRIGYHCRDFFTSQWDRYKDFPGGVLAHATHVKGLGSYDPRSCQESPRIQVTLATGVPRERCEQINLGYRDPASIHVEEWLRSQDDNILVVPRAGETLYRLKT